jgi:alpha-N-arabinofuranosidase
LVEAIYDLQDALIVGGDLITLFNNSDRVKAACLAQLVNVIGAIFTEPGGPAWRQTIFYPFKLVAQNARGRVLQAKVQSNQFETKTAGPIDHLVASAVHNANEQKLVLFVLNRETSEAVDLSIELRGFPPLKGCEASVIAGADLLATNSAQRPDTVQPSEQREFSVRPDGIAVKLRPLSWNMLSLSY